MSTRQSELSVITKAKNLSSYIYTITQKSPKQFRFTLAARCKRNKRDVIDFEYDLASNIWKLHYELKDGTYKLSGYYHFKIFDPKERDIQALYFRDRVMQHSLCDEMSLDEIKRSLASYTGHLRHGHTYRLRKNIFSKFVLTHAKREDY